MENIVVLFFTVLVILCVMLLLREVYCWYAKINERIMIMHKQLHQSEETNRLLMKLLQEVQKEKSRELRGSMYEEAVKLELSGEIPD